MMDGMATDFAALWRLADHSVPAGDGTPQPAPAGTPAAAATPRCTATVRSTGERCKRRPHPGAVVCVMHGAAAPQVKDAAARRVQEQKALELARSYAEVDASRLAGDPIAALEWVIGESHTLA